MGNQYLGSYIVMIIFATGLSLFSYIVFSLFFVKVKKLLKIKYDKKFVNKNKIILWITYITIITISFIAIIVLAILFLTINDYNEPSIISSWAISICSGINCIFVLIFMLDYWIKKDSILILHCEDVLVFISKFIKVNSIEVIKLGNKNKSIIIYFKEEENLTEISELSLINKPEILDFIQELT